MSATALGFCTGCESSQAAQRPESKAVDPVCGVPVDRSTPHFLNLDGDRYYFDSEFCREVFERWQSIPGDDSPWEGLRKRADR